VDRRSAAAGDPVNSKQATNSIGQFLQERGEKRRLAATWNFGPTVR